jgi:ATP-dependent DNA ligase
MLEPPIEPMLAALADELPASAGFLFEPKWDGFRAIVFRGTAEVFIQSRDLRPLDRYFPELHEVFLGTLPDGCVLDGEIVIATAHGLDFDALQLRLHPAASRVAKLAKETPAAFVGFDLLAHDGRDLRATTQRERRVLLEQLLAGVKPPVYLTPMTEDRSVASEWLDRFEGAGLDGVIAKPADGIYQPGKRAMYKIKHARTADCVVAGFRWHKSGNDKIGSLLLGLYDGAGRLHHVGVTSSFTMAARKELALELEPLRPDALKEHPWREWADAGGGEMTRMPGGQSRWSAGKDLSWEPVRVERVCEVKYDQLEVTPAYELEKVFGAASRR